MTTILVVRFYVIHESPSKACPPSPVLFWLGVKVNSLALTLLVTQERLQELETVASMDHSPIISRHAVICNQVYSTKSFAFVPYSCTSATAEAQSLSH